MKHFIVPSLGTGTESNPYRPDLPEGVSFVGHHDPKTGTYLVAVPDVATVSAKVGRTALSTRKAQTDAISARELSEAAVNSWRIG